MTVNISKKKESNLLLLKKDSNFNTSIQELNPSFFNFQLNDYHKKNISKTGRLYNHCNDNTKTNNFQNKNTEHSIINTYIKNSSPTTNFKGSHIDTSNSNIDLTNVIKTKENITNRECQKDSQYKQHFHHKKINSYLSIKNNQILNEIFPNKTKNYVYINQSGKGTKILKKKHIQIDTYSINNNINNHTNINSTTNKLTNNLLSNGNINKNNHHKINLKIYLEKHQRVLSTESNKNKSIKVNSRNKKNEKCVKKNNINSVIKSKRLITNKNSTRLLNNYKSNTLSRANSSWVNKEYNIFNTSIEQNLSKKDKIKVKNDSKKNNVIVKNINNFIKEKKLKNYNNNEHKKNDILNISKLKEKTTLYYLSNISDELKSRKKNFHNGNNIFISINNYSNDNKKKNSKGNVILTEGKELNIQNYITKKCISQNGIRKNKRRNNIIKSENNNHILYDSKNSSQNKTEENFNSNISNNDIIEGPELTHFFIVASIQRGKQNYNHCN